jgi:hypothetical protein
VRSTHSLEGAPENGRTPGPKRVARCGLAQSGFAGWVSSLANNRPLEGNGRSIAEINEN